MNNIYAGLEIGAISLKCVRRTQDDVFSEVIIHGGDPITAVKNIFSRSEFNNNIQVVITGQSAKAILDLPYRSETECLEKAISYLGLDPDIILSLGGETFSVYPMKDGMIKNIIATSKCAAGTGEFIVQQFQRMGMSLSKGIDAGRKGNIVELATRCSVHCKSDATHKLNKGECAPGDIAKSLIYDLAKKVSEMTAMAKWPSRLIVISGGLALNELFLEHLRQCLKTSNIVVLNQSPYLEAFGASLYAKELSGGLNRDIVYKKPAAGFTKLERLDKFEALLDYRVAKIKKDIKEGSSYILGVDAGSTTTKAVLLNTDDGLIGASCYLRTLGNPISAVKKCLEELIKQLDGKSINIIQAASTGSAREIASVFLDNCLSFNEILSHGRAAAQESPDVDTVFEIGGQDSKYISFLKSVPVDYAMNEGCSAGTGSFLEESASVDMGINVADIASIAIRSDKPIPFGERCAAFINTDLRNALQQGALREDVIAGLVYSIAENYISRIVGPRHIGENILFLGGVALNRAVALAMAARTGRKIVVPRRPELMGSVGAALKARDLLRNGNEVIKLRTLEELVSGQIQERGTFRCKTCENNCEIQQIGIRKKVYPFGGLCSKYEKQRHGKPEQEGINLIDFRNRMMFLDFGPREINNPRGTIGLPMALTAFELFPFYVKLIYELGYNVMLSKPSKEGNLKTTSPICYPCQLVHGAVHDLINRKADYILLPHIIRIDDSKEAFLNYTCPSTTVMCDIIRASFEGISGKILSPHIGLSKSLIKTSLEEIAEMGSSLDLKKSFCREAGEKALSYYEDYKETYKIKIAEELEKACDKPAIIIAGRPYIACSADVNLALPRKITSRGYNVISIDMLPEMKTSSHQRDVWHFTRQICNAAAHVKQNPNLYICLVSCFSCGPDASIYHYIRQELAGRTFCYLEIDSHTAHAGFETRVGAFIDIIEEKLQREKNNE